jgi:hypothetical protein
LCKSEQQQKKIVTFSKREDGAKFYIFLLDGLASFRDSPKKTGFWRENDFAEYKVLEDDESFLAS